MDIRTLIYLSKGESRSYILLVSVIVCKTRYLPIVSNESAAGAGFPEPFSGMVTMAETAERISTSFPLAKSFTLWRRLWFCSAMRSGLRDITSDTLILWSGEKRRRSGCSAAGCQRTNTFVPPYSLAIHPDKIRIATGQIAGVDKDGRVSGAWTGEKVIQDSGFFCSLILFKSGR